MTLHVFRQYGSAIKYDYEKQKYVLKNREQRQHDILQQLIKEHFEMVEKYEMQYLDDIDNPLEPIKLKYVLDSEIFKCQYRAKNKPNDINILDYTIIYALKHCLEEQIIKKVEE